MKAVIAWLADEPKTDEERGRALAPAYRGQPLMSRAEHRRGKRRLVIYALVWVVALVVSLSVLSPPWVFVAAGLLLFLAFPAEELFKSYATYQEEWRLANAVPEPDA